MGIYGLFVPGRFVGCELGGGLTPNAAFVTVLPLSQDSKRPTKENSSVRGNGKEDGFTLLFFWGGYS